MVKYHDRSKYQQYGIMLNMVRKNVNPTAMGCDCCPSISAEVRYRVYEDSFVIYACLACAAAYGVDIMMPAGPMR